MQFSGQRFGALKKQSFGLLCVLIHGTQDTVSIQIANTLHGAMDMEQLYAVKSKGGECRGHGLRRVREIVFQNPHIEHYTYLEGRYGQKEVLVQHIVIDMQGV